MKKIISVMLLLVFATLANAQINNPVKWTYTATKIADKTYELHITANIDGNWHLYAQDAGEGPEPTTITFSSNPLLNFEGKVKEVGNMEKSYDKNFKSVLKFYGKKVDFVQKVKVKSPVATVVKGSVSFMVCNDRQCLPPKDVPFSISISGK
ncbi:MAG TPA: protein-disulfide reductase DsbD domain-containing protein [Ferruginibacter sp.]|nr:protein-disulfide reductase DsbD domain-containing protein [Ferruginibacter sp.]